MNTKLPGKLQVVSSLLLVMVFLFTSIGVTSAQDNPQELLPEDPVLDQPEEIKVVSPYLSLIHRTASDGKALTGYIINGPSQPPAGHTASDLVPTSQDGILASFPSFSWVFGCSAVSGAMIATYYDRNGYPKMYEGPTNGGVMPLTDTSWATWSDGYTTYPNNPLIASHKDVDGRTTKGSIDDYWIKYGSSLSDPYITGSWTQHTWGTAIGDYMKTSQSAYGNTDGSTTFWNWSSLADPLTCADMVTNNLDNTDGTYGRKLFYEARGYTVTDCYNRKTYNTISGGFSLADFQAQIDAGHPVFLNLAGHSIVGYGYSGSTVYVRDTWDNDTSHTYTMDWDATPEYSGLTLLSVSIVNLTAPAATAPKLIQPFGTLYDQTPTYKWRRVDGATKYQFRVYTSTGTQKLYRTVYDSSCGTYYCSKVPWVVLPLGNYKWQARAYVGGVYSPWATFKNFTIAKAPSGFSSNFNGSMSGWAKKAGAPFKVNSTAMYSYGYKYWNSVYRTTNRYANFDYSAVVKRTGGNDGGSYPNTQLTLRMGTSVGATYHEWYPGLTFGYTNSGCGAAYTDPCYNIYRTKSDGTFVWIQPWTATTAVKPNDWNTLRVVANGATYKYYINGKLQKTILNTSRSIGYVGMQFYKIPTGTSTRFAVNSAKLSILLKTYQNFDEVDPEQEALNLAAMENPIGTPEFVPAP